jgi:hypothetical protein
MPLTECGDQFRIAFQKIQVSEIGQDSMGRVA